MINQVVSNSVHKRTFSDFHEPKNGWYLAENHHEKEKKRKLKYGKTIAAGALVAGFGTLALMKGAVPKTASKYLEKLKVKLEAKIAKGSSLENFYRKSVERIEAFIQKTQSINNITSLKDVLFQKLMFKTNFTRNIHESITGVFTRIGRKTVNSAYSKTSDKFSKLNEYIINLNDNIIRSNPNKKQVIASINAKVAQLNEHLEKGFGINARNDRLKTMNEASEDLFKYFWNASFGDIKNFKSKEMYQTFIAEAKMTPHKKEMTQKTDELYKVLSDDITSILSDYEKILSKREYRELQLKLESAQNSLKKSIKTETVEFFDKVRDLKLGSAPTDVLSILGTVGAVGWFLGKSKDKDERISASLKYGIPAVGAIATSLLCTAKLISGGKALVFGLISGWLMNKAGEVVDDTRKKYKLAVSVQNRSVLKPQSDKG